MSIDHGFRLDIRAGDRYSFIVGDDEIQRADALVFRGDTREVESDQDAACFAGFCSGRLAAGFHFYLEGGGFEIGERQSFQFALHGLVEVGERRFFFPGGG